jgi:prepilin-type N-terminal cleavage/methylation domain-containing protein
VIDDANAKRFTRHAFTMIELLVVMMLIAILSTSVALSLRPFLIRYSLSRATQQIAMNDAVARATARRLNQPAIVSLDKAARRVAFQCGEVVRRYELPKNVTIDQFLGAVTEIPIEPDGRSPSYAVAVAIGESTRWMVIAGGSGQSMSVENASAARELVAP